MKAVYQRRKLEEEEQTADTGPNYVTHSDEFQRTVQHDTNTNAEEVTWNGMGTFHKKLCRELILLTPGKLGKSSRSSGMSVIVVVMLLLLLLLNSSWLYSTLGAGEETGRNLAATRNEVPPTSTCPALDHAIRTTATYVERGGDPPVGLKGQLSLTHLAAEHVYQLTVPDCAPLVIKLTCRPYRVFSGRQAWPEILASKISTILGLDNVPTTEGFILHSSLFTPSSMETVMEGCLFPAQASSRMHADGKDTTSDDHTTVLLGAVTDFRTFWNEPYLVRSKCRRKDNAFLESLLMITILDFLTLNSDRQKRQNWFTDRKGFLVAMDNGLYALNRKEGICNNEEYLSSLFEQVALFSRDYQEYGWMRPSIRGIFRGCTWLYFPTRRKPICNLITDLRNWNMTAALLRTKDVSVEYALQTQLSRDIWFRFIPLLLSRKLEKDAESISWETILGRSFSSCYNCKCYGSAFTYFIAQSVRERFFLAKLTMRNCLDKP